jgi:hypothetical protein
MTPRDRIQQLRDEVHIDPIRVYTAEEARVLLCPSRPLHVDTVYRMGKRGVLRTVPLGPRGGHTGFQGQALLDYINGKRRIA